MYCALIASTQPNSKEKETTGVRSMSHIFLFSKHEFQTPRFKLKFLAQAARNRIVEKGFPALYHIFQSPPNHRDKNAHYHFLLD